MFEFMQQTALFSKINHPLFIGENEMVVGLKIKYTGRKKFCC
jgi:hypothetical protein